MNKCTHAVTRSPKNDLENDNENYDRIIKNNRFILACLSRLPKILLTYMYCICCVCLSVVMSDHCRDTGATCGPGMAWPLAVLASVGCLCHCLFSVVVSVCHWAGSGLKNLPQTCRVRKNGRSTGKTLVV